MKKIKLTKFSRIKILVHKYQISYSISLTQIKAQIPN